MNDAHFALAKNGLFSKLALWMGLCGFANFPFEGWQKKQKNVGWAKIKSLRVSQCAVLIISISLVIIGLFVRVGWFSAIAYNGLEHEKLRF